MVFLRLSWFLWILLIVLIDGSHAQESPFAEANLLEEEVGYVTIVQEGKEIRYTVKALYRQSRRGGIGFVKISELEKEVLKSGSSYKENTVLNMRFENIPVEAAIKSLSIISGLNLVIDPKLKAEYKGQETSKTPLGSESYEEKFLQSMGEITKPVNIYISKPTPLLSIMNIIVKESGFIVVPVDKQTYLLTKAIEYKIDISGIEEEDIAGVIELLKRVVSPAAEVILDKKMKVIYIKDRLDNLPKLKDLEERVSKYIESRKVKLEAKRQEELNILSKVFYIPKRFYAKDIGKEVKKNFKDVEVSISPEFNAIVVTGKESSLKDIEKFLKPYTMNVSSEEPILARTFYVKFISAETFKTLIQPMLSEVGEVYILGSGIPSTVADERLLRQLVKKLEDTKEKLRTATDEEKPLLLQELKNIQSKIDSLEKKVRETKLGNTAQVEISEFPELEKNQEAIGPLFKKSKKATTFLSNALIVRDRLSVLEQIKDKYQDLISEEPIQIKIEARIVEVDKELLRELGVNWSALLSNTRLPEATSGTIGINPDISGPTPTPTLLGRPSTGGILTFVYQKGILNALNLRLAAFERIRKAKSLAKPAVITLNGEPAVIQSSIQFPVTKVTATQTSVTVSATYESAPLILSVVPVLTPDGRVMLDITLMKKDIVDAVSYNVGAGLTQEFPVFSDKKIDTKVIVSNGDTVVIGGIVSTSKRKSDEGVPGLHRIPLLGWLFKERTLSKQDRELLIFITPTLLNE